MSQWRYLAQRLNGDGTGTFIDTEIPIDEDTITKVCSGPNGLQGKVTPAVARLLVGGAPALVPYSTALYAETDGEIIGFLLTDLKKNGPDLSLTGVGFTGYPAGQPYDGSVFFVEKDPLDIVRHIWDHVQGWDRGNIGVQVDPTTKAGVLIGQELEQVEFDTQEGPVSFESGPYKLNTWDTKDLASNIDTLSKDHHFEYREWHRWNSDRTDVEHHLDFYVPKVGRRRHDLRFVLGENMQVVPDEDFAGDSYADQVIVQGAGEGRTMIVGRALRSGETRLRRTVVVEDKQIRSITAANARAKQELALRVGYGDISQIVVSEHPHAPLGSWIEGDEIRLQGEGPWGSFDLWARVLSTAITPSNPTARTLNVERVDKISS